MESGLPHNQRYQVPKGGVIMKAMLKKKGLFFAVIWNSRVKKGIEGAKAKKNTSLKIFAVATSVQAVVGFWYLLALPSDFISQLQ